MCKNFCPPPFLKIYNGYDPYNFFVSNDKLCDITFSSTRNS